MYPRTTSQHCKRMLQPQDQSEDDWDTVLKTEERSGFAGSFRKW
jgi:hypothetical protein